MICYNNIKWVKKMNINSSLDLWSPQHRGQEILYALAEINEDNKVVLFTNLESQLKVGDYTYQEQFRLCLWVRGTIAESNGIEKQGRLIICLENAPFTEDTVVSANLTIPNGTILTSSVLERIMQEKAINYIKINSNQPESLVQPYKLNKETWIVRNLEVFESSISDTTAKKVRIYPNVKSELTLKYFENQATGYLIDRRNFDCLIEFNDKIMLLVQPTLAELNRYQNNPDSLGYVPINLAMTKDLLLSKGFTIETITSEPDIEIESKIVLH